MLNNGWDVRRVENNPSLTFIPNTTIADIKQVEKQIQNFIEAGHVPDSPTLMWFSPPCREFSNGFNAPRPKARRDGKEFHPDLSIMLACKSIIDMVSPKYWVIENVRGACKDFEPYLGKPKMVVNGYVLWGNFPRFDIDASSLPTKADEDVWSSDPLRANKKAKIPYDLADRLRIAIETQRTLDYWI